MPPRRHHVVQRLQRRAPLPHPHQLLRPLQRVLRPREAMPAPVHRTPSSPRPPGAPAPLSAPPSPPAPSQSPHSPGPPGPGRGRRRRRRPTLFPLPTTTFPLPATLRRTKLGLQSDRSRREPLPLSPPPSSSPHPSSSPPPSSSPHPSSSPLLPPEVPRRGSSLTEAGGSLAARASGAGELLRPSLFPHWRGRMGRGGDPGKTVTEAGGWGGGDPGKTVTEVGGWGGGSR